MKILLHAKVNMTAILSKEATAEQRQRVLELAERDVRKQYTGGLVVLTEGFGANIDIVEYDESSLVNLKYARRRIYTALIRALLKS